MPGFELPSVLQNRSAREFYDKIKAILPKDMDLSEANHYWNLTYPIALVAAEICEFVMPEVVRLIMPEGSYGEFLEGHARERAMSRKTAVAATGELTLTGEVGTIIPKGSLFLTASTNTEPSVEYRTLADATIGEEGTITIEIECTQAGTIGNTGPNTIIFVGSKIKNITAVTNIEDITGGTEQESDDELIARIIEYDQTQGNSYIGNDYDYKRWAMSVDGVGSATIISAEDDSGLVTIILTDKYGNPANETLRENVYTKIMRPDNRELRLAPVNAFLSVIAPETCDISIMATIELEEGATIETVTEKFKDALIVYFPEALEDEEVKYSKIWSVLSSVKGVADFTDLVIGVKDDEGNVSEYGTSNIPVSNRLLPVVSAEDLHLTQGNV